MVYDLITTDHRISIVAPDGSVLEAADYLEVPESTEDHDELLLKRITRSNSEVRGMAKPTTRPGNRP